MHTYMHGYVDAYVCMDGFVYLYFYLCIYAGMTMSVYSMYVYIYICACVFVFVIYIGNLAAIFIKPVVVTWTSIHLYLYDICPDKHYINTRHSATSTLKHPIAYMGHIPTVIPSVHAINVYMYTCRYIVRFIIML